MDTNILTFITFVVFSILFIIDLVLRNTKEVVWKRKKFTADEARKISNDYSEDIDFIEKEIRHVAKQNKTSVELTIDSEKVVDIREYSIEEIIDLITLEENKKWEQ